MAWNFSSARRLSPAVLRALDDGIPQGMLRALLRGSGKLKERVLIQTVGQGRYR